MDKLAGKNTKQLIFYIGMYTSASILGPLLVFGGSGYLLDGFLNTRPWLLISGVMVSFIFTNVFLYRKVISLTNHFNELDSKQDKLSD